MIIRKRREWSTEYLANNEKGTIEHFAQSRQGQICLQTTVAPFHFLSMKILDLTIPLYLQSCGVYEPTINKKLTIPGVGGSCLPWYSSRGKDSRGYGDIWGCQVIQ